MESSDTTMRADSGISDLIPEDDSKFGVLLLGAPGTGKTTYCKAMHEFLNLHYER